MSTAVAPPPDDSSLRSGVSHYARIIATDNQLRRDALGALLGWLASRPVPDWGEVYCVWAELDDLADLYGSDSDFDAQAKAAAEEWLALPLDDAGADHQWLTRWDAWLKEYGDTHSTWPQRGKVAVVRLLVEHWDVRAIGDKGVRPDEVLALLCIGADAGEVAEYLLSRTDRELSHLLGADRARVAAEALIAWYTTN